jgi:uncharacterized membrane protein YhhN
MITTAFLVMSVLVLAMLLVEAQHRPRVVYGTLKIVASLWFFVVGLLVVDDVPGNPAARPLLFIALGFSVLGDVLLVPKGSKRVFQLGLVSFLLAHVMFVPAFIVRGVDWSVVAVVLAVLLAPLVLVLRWLRAHVRGRLWPAVVAYVVVVTSMLAVATGAAAHGQTAAHGVSMTLFFGALCFWASDLTVARERFVAHSFVNRLFGIPLYFLGQLAIIAGYAVG